MVAILLMRHTSIYENQVDDRFQSPAHERDLVLASRDATIPVLGGSGRLVGLITAEQIRPVMDERHLDPFVVAGDIAAPPVFVHPDEDLFRARELFRASGCSQIPVLAERGRSDPATIIGMLDYRDVMHAYGRELARRRDH